MAVRAEEPKTQDVKFDAVLARAAEYLPADRLDAITQAYEFAEKCHEGQLRKTGDPYITHPVSVAYMVAHLELDQQALMAALLHDVQEDCGVPNDVIASTFGERVAKLVDGLTKLDKLPMNVGGIDPARGTLQAQNLRKMFLAMAEDISVVLIKLCDRLHNMRTLWAFPPEKQRRIALETQEIFAPLANRLGVWQIKWELEDLAFRYLEPEKYREIADLLASKRVTRERYIREASAILKEHLDAAGIRAEISGRAKHIASIYNKMNRYSEQSKTFDQIYDLLAVRIFVDSVGECYHALGIIHSIWRPIPGQFDDYIGNPKDSMYQSLHTTVVGPHGRPLEIQIRTYEMHRVAEYGVAAHWRYKEGSKTGRDDERIAWLRQLLDWQRDLTGADDFVESVKTDIFHDQVFVYTPKGDVLDLPAGATPLDFAYRVHTDLGHQTVGAKVNGRMVSLNSQLKNGDVVDVMRSRASKGPSRDWLNANLGYVRTTHSKEKIRQWFRKQERAENIDRGRELIEKEMRRLGLDLSERQEQLLTMFPYPSWEDFLAALGYGGVSTSSIARKMGAAIAEEEAVAEPALPPAPEKMAPATLGSPGMRVLGVGNLLTTMARCCNPLPGDQILGYVTRTRGVTVHRADCHNVLNEEEHERIVEVEWGTVAKLYPVSVRIEAWDRVGLLRDITTVVTEDKVNMVGVRTVENGDGSVTILATLETTGIEQLSRLLSRIEI
ncbi:MAG TPA: bifunctional (p)ppGpp synthetase/guanosine-3',5'-bis(diphosphate) 3'-pyrophosphohydrolase, partial [Tepidiformaceae bacterium]|nr:bifunctional (p)ppGpp synthetase/guanosine-3',5'-bis(diphosphate) 3'-pyrophosphohydrolase [Tepidiformaceae bacterium]